MDLHSSSSAVWLRRGCNIISCNNGFGKRGRFIVIAFTSMTLTLLFCTWGMDGIKHMRPLVVFAQLRFGYKETEIPLSVCSNSVRLGFLQDACRSPNKNGLQRSRRKRNVGGLYEYLLTDDENQILFCVPPKAGSSSFKTMWLNYTRDVHHNGGSQIHDVKFLRKHNLRSLNTYNKSEIRTRLKTYFKFMVARHPLLRVLSAFRQKFEEPNWYYHPNIGRFIEKKYGHIPDKQAKGHNVTFEQFVHFLADTNPAQYDHHWRPISLLCNPCQIPYDYVAKLETNSDDYRHIFAQLESATASKKAVLEAMTARKSVTDFDLVNEYYNGIPAKYMAIFKRKYNIDIELLGYTWNSTSMARGCRIKTDGKECC